MGLPERQKCRTDSHCEIQNLRSEARQNNTKIGVSKKKNFTSSTEEGRSRQFPRNESSFEVTAPSCSLCHFLKIRLQSKPRAGFQSSLQGQVFLAAANLKTSAFSGSLRTSREVSWVARVNLVCSRCRLSCFFFQDSFISSTRTYKETLCRPCVFSRRHQRAGKRKLPELIFSNVCHRNGKGLQQKQPSNAPYVTMTFVVGVNDDLCRASPSPMDANKQEPSLGIGKTSYSPGCHTTSCGAPA